MKGNLRIIILSMVKEFKHGLMDRNCKEFELIMSLMAFVNLIIFQGMFMKDIGLMEKLMDKELIGILME